MRATTLSVALGFLVLGLTPVALARADDAPASDDTHYPCREVEGGKVHVTLKAGYTVQDLALWYYGATCRTVYFADQARGRSAKKAVSRTVAAARIDSLFVELAAALDLVPVREYDLVALAAREPSGVIVLPAWSGIQRVPPAPPAVSAPPTVSAPSTPNPTAAFLDAHVRTTGPNTVEVDRVVVDEILGKPEILARSARVVPSMHGTRNGLKLFAIRPTSVFARLGFHNGDTVHRVNGHSLASPDQVLEVYASLKSADRFTVELTRRDKPLTLTIHVKP